MKGKQLYTLKDMCNSFGLSCHNTKNRVIEKMCECEKKDCQQLADYLQCLMIIEKLCDYICTCCCEDDNVSSHTLQELNMRCDKLVSCCNKLTKQLSKEHIDYIQCEKISGLCHSVKKIKQSSSKTRQTRQTRQTRRTRRTRRRSNKR